MGVIRARPLDDPRNTVSVDNSDPNAHNKLYAGIPGTHLEQRCCDDKPPERLPQMTGWYVDLDGNRVCEIIEYWNRPENRAEAGDGWWNAATPPGLVVEMAATGILMCGGCGDAWDHFVEDLGYTLDELLPVIEGIAIAASYFPVVGTAVSFILSSAVGLAKGADLDEAALAAIGDALPGQPVSGATYRVTRAMLEDGSIDEIALSALPVDDDVRRAIGSSVRIVVAVAEGEDLTDAVLAEIYAALPETGRRGIDVARRIIAGEDVSEFVVSEATRAAADLARQHGSAAVNRFIAESGFQSAVETIDPIIQASLRLGIGIRHAESSRQFIGEFNSAEEHTARNDALAAEGARIIAGGATWRGCRLADIRAASSFTFTRTELDPLTNIERVQTNVHRIDDRWRRGFDVAVGLCEGSGNDNEEQRLVRLSLGAFNAQQGFDAGQYIQHSRTEGEWRPLLLTEFDPGQTQVEMAGRRVPSLVQEYEDARQLGQFVVGRVDKADEDQVPDVVVGVKDLGRLGFDVERPGG